MTETLIALLVFMVIVAVALWLVGQLGLPAPTQKIITVVVVAVALIVLLVRFLAPFLRG